MVKRMSQPARWKIGLAAMSLVGLLLAVAGMTSEPAAMENLQDRLVLDLPGWLWIPFILLLSLETIFIARLLIPALLAGRKRRQGQRSTSAAVVFLLLAATAFWVVPPKNVSVIDDLLGNVVTKGDPASPAESSADSPPAVHSELVSGVVETLLLALALIGFGVAAWLYLGTRQPQGHGTPRTFAPSALQMAVEDSLSDLRHLPDVRLAIIRCYDRFERALAGVDVRRAPWETAMEFMRTALKRPGLPRDDVHELTSLFELARFSRHELGPEHRERAWNALMAVREGIEGEAR
jgi:hypothetical protein